MNFFIYLEFIMLFLLRLFLRKTYTQSRGMKIIPIPVNEDNYQYLIVDEKTEHTAVVDPVDIKSVIH